MRVLTQARDLSRRKARERDGLFVAEGVRAVEELVRSPVVVVGILCAPQLIDTMRGAHLRAEIERLGLPISDVSEREFASAASTESPQGVLALAQIPPRSLSEFADRDALRLLVLDAVQDPGNVGTLLRTAHALGIDGTVALPGTVDLWNAKVVRSAMGSLFRHYACSASLDVFGSFLENQRIPLWGADVKGSHITGLKPLARCALVVGNEGTGLTDVVRAQVGQLVSIPMAGDAMSR
jgi:RNA methyltransferase, TrmH family